MPESDEKSKSATSEEKSDKQDKTIPVFQRIYFDANIMIEQRWPASSVGLRNLLTFAKELEVKCIIPEPVCIEIEEQWFRELKIKEKDLSLHIERIGSPRLLLYANRDAAIEQYQNAVKSQLQNTNIEICPLTSTPLQTIFRMAASHEAPFDKDNEFRDRVIWLSVIEDLAKQSDQTAVFLGKDKVYEEESFRAIVNKRKVNISIQKQVSDVIDFLKARLTGMQRVKFIGEWMADMRLAKAAVNEPDCIRRIETYLAANLSLQEYDLRAIKQLLDVEILDVETALPVDAEGRLDVSKGFARKPGENVKISINVAVKLEVRVRQRAPLFGLTFEPLKVGEERKEEIGFGNFITGVELDETWTKEVQVEATSVLSRRL